MKSEILKEIKEYWASLLMLISGEDISQYEALLRMEALEFFTLIKVHEKIQVEKIKRINKRNKK